MDTWSKQRREQATNFSMLAIRALGWPLLVIVSLALFLVFGYWTQPDPRDAVRAVKKGMTVQQAIDKLAEIRPYEVSISDGKSVPIQDLQNDARIKSEFPSSGIEHFTGQIEFTSFNLYSSYVLALKFSDGKLIEWDYGYLPG